MAMNTTVQKRAIDVTKFYDHEGCLRPKAAIIVLTTCPGISMSEQRSFDIDVEHVTKELFNRAYTTADSEVVNNNSIVYVFDDNSRIRVRLY